MHVRSTGYLLVLALAGLGCASHSFRGDMQALCTAVDVFVPRPTPEQGQALGRWVRENLKDQRAIDCFSVLDRIFDPVRRGQALAICAQGAGVTRCPLADRFQAAGADPPSGGEAAP